MGRSPTWALIASRVTVSPRTYGRRDDKRRASRRAGRKTCEVLEFDQRDCGSGIRPCDDAGAQAGEFDGVTVNLMTQTGAIQEPLQRRAPDFEKMTGAKINIIAVPFSDLYQKVLTDWASGTNSVDAAVFAPQWMVDYVVRRLSRGPRAARRQGQGHQVGRDRPVLPELLGHLRRQDLSHPARWRLPHALLPDRRVREGRAASRRRPGMNISTSPRR